MRVVAGLLDAVHVDRVLVVDLHIPAIEAMFAMLIERISAAPILARCNRSRLRTLSLSPRIWARSSLPNAM